MKQIWVITFILIVFLLIIQPVSGLPFFKYNTTINISGGSVTAADYQIKCPVDLLLTGYPIFTYANVTEPHYDNILDSCMLPGDERTIWVKVPIIPREGISLKMWYKPVYPMLVDQDCRKVFIFYDEPDTKYINYVVVRRLRP